MNPQQVQFRKLVYFVIEEQFKNAEGSFWEGLGGNDDDELSKEDAIMDFIEVIQLIVGLYLRRMARDGEPVRDDEEIEMRVAMEKLGTALLDKIDEPK